MNQYKPEYLGKAMPVDDTSKLTDFVANKYDSFSKIYDACKDQSEKISDIKTVENNSNDSSSLSIKVSADKDVIDNIKENVKDDEKVTVENDVVTARS